ncbi:MAG: GNAT family N-acetyltransferase [Candidatus Acidiferrales bacterium]
MATSPSSTPRSGAHPRFTVRRAAPLDAEACGRICFEAFTGISRNHNFPPDFPSVEVAVELLSIVFSHPGFFCVVAEENGKVVGSNCMDERDPVAGIGPITIDPQTQNRSAGRELMQAVLDRAAERKFPGVRLVQAAFHNRSLSLYAKLGFIVREPLSCMQGPAIGRKMAGYTVRPAVASDLENCAALCLRVHGHERAGQLRDGIAQSTAVVAERGGQICAYASQFAFFGHAVAESNEDLQALISTAPAFEGSGILVPTRNSGLFRWCLENGLRVVQPMTLMTIGLYNEPAGAYLPSILY